MCHPLEDEAMNTRGAAYPAVVQELAVWLVQEQQGDYPAQLEAVTSIASHCGTALEPRR